MTKRGALDHIATLDQAVDFYLKAFDFSKPGANHSVGHDDPVVDFCRKAEDLPEAIWRACDGRREDGKMFSKGSCVRTKSKRELYERLLEVGVSNATDFDQLYDMIDHCRPWGIGDMYIYTVTERVGAYLGLKPEFNLYLHAGPLVGWKRLTGRRERRHRVPFDEVPAALRRLPNYHVENFLCELRDFLHPGLIT
jgi:hypothetical protein